MNLKLLVDHQFEVKIDGGREEESSVLVVGEFMANYYLTTLQEDMGQRVRILLLLRL